MAPSKPPTGTVTFLFTDIVGSTEKWEEHGDSFLPVLQTHNAIVSDAIARNGGYLMKTEGDSFKVAFANPVDALKCAIVAQSALQSYPWPADVGPVRVRMALHTGTPFYQAGDYFGPPLNRTARILSACHGGQIILSEDTLRAVADEAGADIAFHDQGHHTLRDLDEPLRLYQADHPALPTRRFPPLRSLNGHAHNLPVQRRSFIGREREIEHVAAALTRGDTRLLTLTGPAGIGKTRLGVQVAAESNEWFPDGTWVVSMDRACDAETAAAQVAATLGVTVPPGNTAPEAVRDWLARRRCLLILDDCGHVPEAGRLIRELLSGAPDLRCLATARQPLPGAETPAVEVPGLELPPADAGAAAVLGSESGRHFMERVVEARPGFTLTEQRGPVVSRLLNKLEGVPASTEMAAEMFRLPETTAGRLLEAVGGPELGQTVEKAGRAAAERGRELLARLKRNPTFTSLLHSVTNASAGAADQDAAERRCRDALAIFQQAGDRVGICAALRQLGNMALARKDYARATALLSAAHQEAVETHSVTASAVAADLECARHALGASQADAAGRTVTVEEAIALALDR